MSTKKVWMKTAQVAATALLVMSTFSPSFNAINIKPSKTVHSHVNAATTTTSTLVPGQTVDTGNHALSNTAIQNTSANWTMGGSAYNKNNWANLVDNKGNSVGYATYNRSLDATQAFTFAGSFKIDNPPGTDGGAGDALGFILSTNLKSLTSGGTGGNLGIGGNPNTFFLGRDMYYNSGNAWDGPTANGWSDGAGNVIAIRRTLSSGVLDPPGAGGYPSGTVNNNDGQAWATVKPPNNSIQAIPILSDAVDTETYTIKWVPTSTSGNITTGTLSLNISGTTITTTTGLQNTMSIGIIGGTGGNISYLSANISGFTGSGNRGTEPVIVNYMNTATGTAVKNMAASTITASVGDQIGVTNTAGATDDYTYAPPAAPAGYTYSSSSPSVVVANYDTTTTTTTNPNAITVNYTPNPQTSNLSFAYSNTGAPAIPSGLSYTGYTDGTFASTINSDVTAKVPAGYYVSKITNVGTGTSYTGTTTAATLASANLSANTYSATAANNNYTVTLTPLAQTATFTYGWSTTVPGAGGGVAGQLQGTLPANVSQAGVTDAAITNPGVANIPAGYYIVVTAPNGTTYGDANTAPATALANAIAATKGPAGAAGTMTASGNNFNVALFAKTVTVPFTYQWASGTPGSGILVGTLPTTATQPSGLVGAPWSASTNANPVPSNGGALAGYIQSVVGPKGNTYTVSGTTATITSTTGAITTATVASGTTALQYAFSQFAYLPASGGFSTTYSAMTNAVANFTSAYVSGTPGTGTTAGTAATLPATVSFTGTTGTTIPTASVTAPAGYTISSITTPDGKSAVDLPTAQKNFPYFYSGGFASNFVVNLTANTQSAGINFNFASKPAPTVNGTLNYSGLTGAPLSSTIVSDMTAKVPAGYYISKIVTAAGTGTTYTGTSTAATLAAAGMSTAVFSGTSLNNIYNVTMTASSQTENFTYAWDSSVQNPPANSLPAAISYTGNTDTALQNPGVTNIPNGYYIVVTAPNGKTFDGSQLGNATAMANAIASQTGPANVAGTYGTSNNFAVKLYAATQTASVGYLYVSGTPGADATGLPSTTPVVAGVASALPTTATISGATGTTLTLPSKTIPSGYAIDHVVGPDGNSYATVAAAQAAFPTYSVNSNSFTIYLKALTQTPTVGFGFDEAGSSVAVPTIPAAVNFQDASGNVWSGLTGSVIPSNVIAATQAKILSALSGTTYQHWSIYAYAAPNGTNYTGGTLATAVAGGNNVVLGASNNYTVKLAYSGSIALQTPSNVDFGNRTIVGTNKTYKGTMNADVTVVDNRATVTPWNVTVAQTTPIQQATAVLDSNGNPTYDQYGNQVYTPVTGGISFNNCLTYAGSTLTSTPVAVTSNTGTAGTTTVLPVSTTNWQLAVPVGLQKPNVTFVGTVTWTLNLTPQ